MHYSETHLLDLPKHYKFLKDMTNTEIKTVAVMGSMHEIGFLKEALMKIRHADRKVFMALQKML